MNTRKLLVIIKREYLTRVTSKGFIVGTILTPLLMASLLLVPVFLTRRGMGNDYRVAVLDQTADIALYEHAAGLLTAEDARIARFQLRREAVSGVKAETRRQELNREISEGKLDSYIVIPPLVLDEGKIDYHARNTGDFIAETRLENAFNTAVIERRMTRSGLNAEHIRGLSQKIVMEKFNERGEGENWQKIITAFLLMGILCLTVLAYGGHIMTAVIEEKQSRIIEVLLSSVQPFPLMLGKLVGVGLVGLTQYAVWAVGAVLLSGLTASQSTALGSFSPQISISLMFFFVVFFLLGYFLYGTLFVMVGGTVSNEEDGQQLQLPLMVLILLAPLASSLVWRQPDSILTIAISLFPFFTPFAMFLRVAIHEPPFWQIALSIFLMVAAILGAVWLAAKLYRVGVLMYGKRPTLPEMAKWLRTS